MRKLYYDLGIFSADLNGELILILKHLNKWPVLCNLIIQSLIAIKCAKHKHLLHNEVLNWGGG